MLGNKYTPRCLRSNVFGKVSFWDIVEDGKAMRKKSSMQEAHKNSAKLLPPSNAKLWSVFIFH